MLILFRKRNHSYAYVQAHTTEILLSLKFVKNERIPWSEQKEDPLYMNRCVKIGRMHSKTLSKLHFKVKNESKRHRGKLRDKTRLNACESQEQARNRLIIHTYTHTHNTYMHMHTTSSKI